MPNKNRELKKIADHNAVGAKEQIILPNEQGEMFASDTKQPPICSSPANVPTTDNEAALVTPNARDVTKRQGVQRNGPAKNSIKKARTMKVARDRGQQPLNHNATIFQTESLGPGGEIIVLTAFKRDNNDVFLKPILNNIANPTSDSGRALVDIFDCRLSDPRHLYLRKSREENVKIPLRNKQGLFRIGIIAFTNKDNFKNKLKKDPFHLEKQFSSECEKILKAHNLKSEFEPWKNSNSHTVDGFRPLDHVLWDETVAHVLGVYFVDKDKENSTDVCNMLQEAGWENMFFSRHPVSNKYCDIAVTRFGFPE